MSNPSVSVIIPAYNCSKTIKKVINSVLAQSLTPNEIIIVDDGSTDSTEDIVKSIKDVKYLRQKNAGPAAARNLGAKNATSELFFFTDSDCLPMRGWLITAVKNFTNPSIAVVCGSYGIANPEIRLARGIQNEILFRHNHLMPKFPKVFGSYNFGIRKDDFNGVGGFNESYRDASGEDNDLSYKILKYGKKINFEPKSIVQHFHTTSLKKYFKEQFRHGYWRVKMYFEFPQMAKGDHYTFWKDMVEIFMAMLSVLLLVTISYNPKLFLNLVLVLNMFLICLEVFYSKRMNKSVTDVIYYSCVMFLRSYVRFFGLSSGIFGFFIFKKHKKKQINVA